MPGQVLIWFIVFSKLTLKIPSFVAHKRVPVCFLFMRVMCETEIDWSSLSGAKTECRKLYLKEDNEGLFKCPVVPCAHNGFATKRGCRKHLHSKHPWYFYFDNKPQDKVQDKRIIGQDTTVKYNPKKRADTTKKPHFPIQGEICEDLINWLCAACGRGMSFSTSQTNCFQSYEVFEILL